MNMYRVLVGSRRRFSTTSDIDGEPSRLRFLHVIVLDEHNQEALGREQIDVDFRQQFDGGPCLPIVDNGEHRLDVGYESLDPVQDLENAAFATAPDLGFLSGGLPKARQFSIASRYCSPSSVV